MLVYIISEAEIIGKGTARVDFISALFVHRATLADQQGKRYRHKIYCSNMEIPASTAQKSEETGQTSSPTFEQRLNVYVQEQRGRVHPPGGSNDNSKQPSPAPRPKSTSGPSKYQMTFCRPLVHWTAPGAMTDSMVITSRMAAVEEALCERLKKELERVRRWSVAESKRGGKVRGPAPDGKKPHGESNRCSITSRIVRQTEEELPAAGDGATPEQQPVQ